MPIPAGCVAYDDLFATEAVRMVGDIDMPGRYTSRFTQLLEKGPIPDGAGFNWQTVVSDNSLPTNAIVWTAVQANEGSSGTCVATANPIKSATTILDYSAFQTAFKSEDICLLDARYGYMFEKQTQNKKTNFERNIVDAWEERDRAAYISAARYKYVAAANLPHTTDNPGTLGNNGSGFPLVPATAPLSQEMMEVFLRKLDRDGAQQAGGAYAMREGRAIYLVLMESEGQERIIKTSTSTRQDFQWSDATKGDKAVLREKMGLDRPYGGAFYMIDDRMPRFDFDSVLGYIERPFFTSSATSIGSQAVVSSAYENAQYGMAIFFHPKVVERLMPGNLSTVGAGTKFGPISYNGDIAWLNFPTDCNPRQTIGYWRADLMSAFRPDLVQYGYVIIYNRCINQLYSFGTCY